MNHECSRPRRTAVALDPHPLCHTALTTVLGRFDIDLVGGATTTDTALALLQELRPDLLVLDVDLPEGRDAALSLISGAPDDVPGLTVVVLSGTSDRCVIDAAFDHGAAAYVLKTSEPDEIATAIRQTFEPSLFLARSREHAPATTTSGTTAVEDSRDVLQKLTRRELEILQLVSGGRSNRQVAQILWVADQTVKFHLANVYRKLGVRSRFEAARWARENGILDVVVDSGEAISMAEPRTNGSGNGNGSGGSSLVPLRRRTPRSTTPRGRFGETSR